ncbi:unnamed protein product [Fusarium graminearum]|nr:unnamed protein product [Fusarium graminearum]VTO94293.1 unnamed protein product [Fusarium graminearum]
MESVWFKLKHTHNVAPDVTKLGMTEETGPILLGHFIPDLDHLDQVINRSAIHPFPPSMDIWPSRTVEFEWADSKSSHVGASGSVAIPTHATAGLTLKASARVAFRQSVENFAKFDSLDSYIVNPTNAYIHKCIQNGPVAEYIAAKGMPGTYKLFMITGIMIARAARTSHKEEKGSDTDANVGFSVSPVGAASGEGHLNKHSGHSLSGTSVTDFVWAIRLARISKNLGDVILGKDWSMVTETKGATFAPRNNEVDVAEVVAREGMTSYGQVIEDEETELAFVV